MSYKYLDCQSVSGNPEKRGKKREKNNSHKSSSVTTMTKVMCNRVCWKELTELAASHQRYVVAYFRPFLCQCHIYAVQAAVLRPQRTAGNRKYTAKTAKGTVAD